MFFIGIFGIGKDKKELRTFPNIICPCCGRYTQAKLVMEYSYFHLFFLPLFKFSKKFFVLPSCGCSVYEADAEYANELQTAAYIDMNRLTLISRRNICRSCMREVGNEFSFCPYCGSRL